MAKAAKQVSNDLDKRERILAAARKLISKHGFEATSTKAIAAEAGVPSGLVFYYFETKDDLIEALFDETTGFCDDAVRNAMQRSQSIDAFLRDFYEGYLANRYSIQIVVAAIASGHAIAQKATAMRRRNVTLIAEYLRSQSSGKPSVDPKVLARVILSSILTVTLLDSDKPVPGFVSGLASVVKCGLAPRG